MNSFAEKGAALAACALLVFGLSGCGGSSSSASKDTLRVGEGRGVLGRCRFLALAQEPQEHDDALGQIGRAHV